MRIRVLSRLAGPAVGLFAAFLGLTAGGRMDAAPAPPLVQARLGSEARLWWYGTAQGDAQAQEHYVPLDLSWQARPWLGLSAGADLLYRRVQDPSGTIAGTEPGEVRLSLRTDLWDHRLSLVAGGAAALVAPGLDVGDAGLAAALENSVFGFPWVRSAWGSRLQAEIACQCLRRRRLILQAGAEYEWRSAYDLYNTGPRFHPGARVRLAGEALAFQGRWKETALLRLDRSGRNRLEGDDAWRPGLLLHARATVERAAGWGAYGIGLGGSWRDRGRVTGGQILDGGLLSGGTLGWGRAFVRKAVKRATVEFFVGGTGVRGFAGDLGHATWAEPGAAYSRALAGGRLRLELSGDLGRDRSGGRLRGLGFSWGWSGGIL